MRQLTPGCADHRKIPERKPAFVIIFLLPSAKA
jgi:hypothetical protein